VPAVRPSLRHGDDLDIYKRRRAGSVDLLHRRPSPNRLQDPLFPWFDGFVVLRMCLNTRILGLRCLPNPTSRPKSYPVFMGFL
jgi:hypothetical protein